MSGWILSISITATSVMLGVAVVLAAIRAFRGPRAQDRVLALDTVYVNVMLLMMTLGLKTGTGFFFEASFIIAVLGFVATAALAKFLMRGEVIE